MKNLLKKLLNKSEREINTDELIEKLATAIADKINLKNIPVGSKIVEPDKKELNLAGDLPLNEKDIYIGNNGDFTDLKTCETKFKIGKAAEEKKPETKLLNTEEAAEFLGVSVTTVYQLSFKKQITTIKNLNRNYYSKHDLENYKFRNGKRRTNIENELKLNFDETIEFLKIKRESLFDFMKKGQINFRRENGVIIFERSDLIDFLKNRSKLKEIELSFKQAYEFLGVSRSTLYELIKYNQIKGEKKDGLRWSFLKSDLENYLKTKKQKQ